MINDDGDYSFLDDWDEGQKEIELIGFIPLGSIEPHTLNPKPDMVATCYIYDGYALYDKGE